MCAVSNIGDQYSQRWPNGNPFQGNPFGGFGGLGGVTREEFEQLRKEVIEMKRLLLDAKAKDIAEGNPDCEMEAKVKILRAVADAVGISLDEVFGPKGGDSG